MFFSPTVAFFKHCEHFYRIKKIKTNSSITKKCLPDRMISTNGIIIPWCFLAASKPCNIKTLKYANMSESIPPITSTNSCVSLNGDVSNPKFLGEVDKINPKSMCIKCPSLFKSILPLCLKQDKHIVVYSLDKIIMSIITCP